MAAFVISREAEKEYSKLPVSEKKKVDKKISLLISNPISGKLLNGELDGLRSLRAWPYRIIYRFDIASKTLQIVHIIHRQGVYK